MTSSPPQGLSWAVNQFDIESIVELDLPRKDPDLNQHEIFKVERILETLGSYLHKLSRCAKGILSQNANLDWYYDNRKIVFQLVVFLKKIDAYLSSIFNLRVSLTGNFPLEKIASLSMDSMQLITGIKKRSEVATSYMELRHSIIDTLDIELSECSTEMFAIKNTFRPPFINEKLTLESVLEKFRFDGLRKISSPKLSSATLPSLYDGEESGFERLDQLEKRLDPMQASIEFLGQKISEFDSVNSTAFQDANELLVSDFRNLQNRWDTLLVNFAALKRNSIDSRYYKIFYFVITEVSDRVHKLIRHVKNDGILVMFDKIAGDFKVCSSTIKFINLAFKDSLIYQKDLLSLYNESVLPRWSYLNVLLEEEKPTSPHAPSRCSSVASTSPISHMDYPSAGIDEIMAISDLSLEPHVSASTKASQRKSGFRVSSGGSLNLGLGISSVSTVPCSVVKTDRILDLNIDAQEIPKSNIQMAIMGLSETSGVEQKFSIKGGDTTAMNKRTLKNRAVPKNVLSESSVPNFSPVNKASRKSSIYSPSTDLPLILEKNSSDTKKWTTKQLLECLKKNALKTKIPTISANYHRLQLPTIKKMEGKTKIASISPDNPVFYSPERRAELKTPHRHMSSSTWCDLPSVLENTPEEYRGEMDTEDSSIIQTPDDKKLLSPWVDKRHLTSFASSTVKNILKTPPLDHITRKPSLTSGHIPHLSPSDNDNLFLSPTWRSTSPERPNSSMGSRYDDVNLMQPLKVPKQRWK